MKLNIAIFVPVMVLLVACGNPKQANTPQGMLEEAQSLIDQSRYADAIEALRNLVKSFPEDSISAQAQYLLGDTFMAYAKDFDQSIQEYRQVVSRYSQSRYAVNAQFMIGYIYANFINDTTRARTEYETFLDQFSDRADSNLIESVQFELDNLGKDLNDVPQLRHITS